jgi:hypothetical protein
MRNLTLRYGVFFILNVVLLYLTFSVYRFAKKCAQILGEQWYGGCDYWIKQFFFPDDLFRSIIIGVASIVAIIIYFRKKTDNFEFNRRNFLIYAMIFSIYSVIVNLALQSIDQFSISVTAI